MSSHRSVVEAVEQAATVVALRRLMLLLVFFAVAACSFVAWYEYNRTARHALHALDDISRLAQEQALNVLSETEDSLNTLLHVVSDRPQAEIRKHERPLHQQANRVARDAGHISNLIVWDEAGRALVSGRYYPVPGTVSIADRGYFNRHKQGADLSITTQERGRVSGRERIVITKTRRDAAGRFAGVLTASVSPRVFADFYRHVVSDRSDFAIAMVSRNGEQVAGYPSSSRMVNVGYDSALRATIDSVAGNALYVLDGRSRYAVYRQLGAYPLYVVVSRGKESIFAEWRHDLVMLGAVGFPGIALVIIFIELAARKAEHEQKLIVQCHAEEARRIEAEAEVRHVQKLEALGQLTGGIAHDFNGLLQLIANGVSALEATGRVADKQPHLSFIRKAIAGAGSLSSHLLTLSRKRELQLEEIRPEVVIPEMCEFARLALPAEVKLVYEVDCDAWPINIDRSELELAIINLVVNARDAMAGKGVISIRVRNIPASEDSPVAAKLSPGDYVALSVRDTGPGIPESAIDHVFEPFFTTKSEGKGTGLGLSRVHRYAVELGGVAVAENARDGGAIITLYIRRAMSASRSEIASFLEIRTTASAIDT